MANRKRIETLDPLAEPLWREAQLVRPEFSEDLHARLRSVVRSAGPVGPQAAAAQSTGCPGRRKLRRDLMSWATAAVAALALSLALLAGLAFVCHTPGQPPALAIAQAPPSEPVKPAADDLDSTAALLETTAAQLGQWMGATVDDNQWAGLDRDAQTAMETVTGPLPFDLSLALAATDPE